MFTSVTPNNSGGRWRWFSRISSTLPPRRITRHCLLWLCWCGAARSWESCNGAHRRENRKDIMGPKGSDGVGYSKRSPLVAWARHLLGWPYNEQHCALPWWVLSFYWLLPRPFLCHLCTSGPYNLCVYRAQRYLFPWLGAVVCGPWGWVLY